MAMNIRQEKTIIKATEVNSTTGMQCKVGSDIRKGEVVGNARLDSESAEGMVLQVIACAMV